MPDDSTEDYEEITVSLPASMARELQEAARQSFRTLDGQVAFWLSRALTRTSVVSRNNRRLPGQALYEAIANLHLQQGQPSSRDIARKCGNDISRTTICDIISGRRVVSWRIMETLVKALDGDVHHFRDLWIEDQKDR